MTDVANLWKFDLRQGRSKDPRQGACLLDAVSWLEYGELDDHPPCVCPAIATLGRTINDLMRRKPRQKLRAFIPRLVGTVDDYVVTYQRANYIRRMTLGLIGTVLEEPRLTNPNLSLKDATQIVHHMLLHFPWNLILHKALTMCDTPSPIAIADCAAKCLFEISCFKSPDNHSYHTWLEEKMVEMLDGVLQIGKQAEPVPEARLADANERFTQARRHGLAVFPPVSMAPQDRHTEEFLNSKAV